MDTAQFVMGNALSNYPVLLIPKTLCLYGMRRVLQCMCTLLACMLVRPLGGSRVEDFKV